MKIHNEPIRPIHQCGTGARALDSESSLYARFGKRVLDIVVLVFVAPVAIVIVAIAAVAVMLDGHFPFYVQRRVGRYGVPFRMFKIRTMVPDAETRLEGYLKTHPEESHEWQTTQKLRRDPRVTRLGRFLRMSSIDELPQLLNVLLGDMSLVGPRPMMENQRQLYPGNVYYKMRPGLTGLWQVSERNECEFRERARYDAEYCREMGFLYDLGIMVRTVGVIARCGGH